MNSKLLSSMLLLALAISGCKNTAEGMKADAQESGQLSAEAAQTASDSASKTGKDVEAATTLTPKVKLAITADDDLNNAKNTINVNSSEKFVVLEGNVTSFTLKALAESIAKNVLKENNAGQTVVNRLEVNP